jgi:hypothetical protein
MVRKNWTLAERMTLFILFNTYGSDAHSRVWWPIFTTLNGTAREWVTVSEDWRFRGGKDRSNMWKRVDKLFSNYDAEELRVYQQTKVNVDAEAARQGIAIPSGTQAAQNNVLPAAPTTSTALLTASIPAATPTTIFPVASTTASVAPAASVATNSVAAASTAAATSSATLSVSTRATNVLPTASSSTQHVAQGSSRFDRFIDQLHKWKRLPVVHTRNVVTSGDDRTVEVRIPGLQLKLPSDIFLLAGSPFGPQVNRVTFSDQVTRESAEVDVLFCRFCVACGTDNAVMVQRVALQPIVVLPVVHNTDIAFRTVQGAVFLPRPQSCRLNAVHSVNNTQTEVYFTGGKRALVEAVD